jgi:hypothetical protein
MVSALPQRVVMTAARGVNEQIGRIKEGTITKSVLAIEDLARLFRSLID